MTTPPTRPVQADDKITHPTNKESTLSRLYILLIERPAIIENRTKLLTQIGCGRRLPMPTLTALSPNEHVGLPIIVQVRMKFIHRRLEVAP